MMLSDETISSYLAAEKLTLAPIERAQIQPSSVDLRLGYDFLTFNTHQKVCIDPAEDNSDLHEHVQLQTRSDEFVLHPGEFVLGATMETIGLPDDLVGVVNGKSSLGRLGLLIHATAGFIDPGFRGNITLELSNVAELPIKLRPTMRIAQVSFAQLDRPASRPYGHPGLGSKYQDQDGVVASRYELNYRPPSTEPEPLCAVCGLPERGTHSKTRTGGYLTGHAFRAAALLRED